MHSKGIIHADIKPSNIMSDGIRWRLIDLTSACRVGDDMCSGSSSAFVPPEAIVTGEDGTYRVVEVTDQKLSAHPSFDIWSLGCVLYNMCSRDNSPLFQADNHDCLSQIYLADGDSIHTLTTWCDGMKARKLERVEDPLARNLISLLLFKDPLKRCSMDRLLQHPFITRSTKVTRLPGEQAKKDVFLSYRVASDLDFAELLYDLLTSLEITVWFDKKCLKPGEPWEEGFCSGLCSSMTFVCILSKEGINSKDKAWQNFGKLTKDSPCDNVHLEHRLALELRTLGYISKVFPVMIGEYEPITDEVKNFFASDSLPKFEPLNTSITSSETSVQDPSTPPSPSSSNGSESYTYVEAVEKKLDYYMSSQALGSPLEPKRSVKSVLDDIIACQGKVMVGKREDALREAAEAIRDMIKDLKKNTERS